MGYGLFVPEFRAAFSMSSSEVGAIASLGFIGFFLALLTAEALLVRRGPEAPVLLGLIAATAGMAAVALAGNLPVLALGVFLTSSSAGFAWTPFNDAVHRRIWDEDRPTALSKISTGTGVGVMAAGIAAFGMATWGVSWRVCWMFFACASGAALLGNWWALRDVEKDPDGLPPQAWHHLRHRAVVPLLVIGFAYGTTSAVYISFVADPVRDAGGAFGIPAAAMPPVVFIAYGLCGLFGLLTGRVRAAVGLAWLLRLMMAAAAVSAVLLAMAPGHWGAIVVSAGLQGLHVMMVSAVLAFWSERLFPTLPSLSFTAALLAMAAGSVIGPALAGVVADAFGVQALFLGLAVLPASIAVLLRDRHAQECPARSHTGERL
ncbi:MAG: Arabinose efflux permease [Rhodobacteraceae bacterium HLUCCA12]|nr:MAG: Arabinose efflux permease [Rhodobacteraceae bacterium HLUCCA12]